MEVSDQVVSDDDDGESFGYSSAAEAFADSAQAGCEKSGWASDDGGGCPAIEQGIRYLSPLPRMQLGDSDEQALILIESMKRDSFREPLACLAARSQVRPVRRYCDPSMTEACESSEGIEDAVPQPGEDAIAIKTGHLAIEKDDRGARRT